MTPLSSLPSKVKPPVNPNIRRSLMPSSSLNSSTKKPPLNSLNSTPKVSSSATPVNARRSLSLNTKSINQTKTVTSSKSGMPTISTPRVSQPENKFQRRSLLPNTRGTRETGIQARNGTVTQTDPTKARRRSELPSPMVRPKIAVTAGKKAPVTSKVSRPVVRSSKP